MEQITAYMALLLTALFFIGLIVLDFLLKKTFTKLYSGEKKMLFWGKIAWLKKNYSGFELDDQAKVKTIIAIQKISIVILVAMFLLFLVGNLVK